MGIEYKIKFTYEDKDHIEQRLRLAPYFVAFDSTRKIYEFRAEDNLDLSKMPDVEITFNEDGLYFCDYGDQSVANTILGHIIRRISSLVDNLTIEQL